MRHFQKLMIVLGVIGAALLPSDASARVRLESICTIAGQNETKLTGIGLVVGLDGTGDGGRNLPAMRALSAALSLMNSQAAVDELRDAKNVAIVLVEATVPRTGLRRGQKIDCYVSSIFGAKSLRGGRLLVSPVETADVRDDAMVGLASGAIFIEEEELQTTGLIPQGITLEQDFVSHFIDMERGGVVTLLLDRSHASFYAASEIARRINEEFMVDRSSTRFEGTNSQSEEMTDIARAVGEGVVEVRLTPEYRQSPVEFVAEILAVSIDNPHTQARVEVNSRTKTVIVTGEVEISPVTISHPRLTVQVGDEALGEPVEGGRFAAVEQQGQQSQQQLKQLVAALNELRVPPEDILNIIRELHRSGKLHAEYDEH